MMEITTLNEKEAPLLERKDYTLRCAFEGATPSRATLLNGAAKHLGVKSETMVVRCIKQAFGESAARLFVSVYKDAGALKRMEPAYIEKRHESAREPAKERKEEAEGSEKSSAGEEQQEETPSEEQKAAAPEAQESAEPAEKPKAETEEKKEEGD